MAVTVRWGTVTAVTEQHERLVRLEVDGDPCVAYPQLTGEVAVGDVVLVNVQAQWLGLGSGGFDILHANLTRGLRLPAPTDAHVMSLPYTPVQMAIRHAEEEDWDATERIDGVPVVCCGVHSQVAPVCAAIGPRRTYVVQLGGGALAVSLSDTLRVLRDRRLLEQVIAVAPCFDGDLQCVSLPSALTVAAAFEAEAIVCCIGPGIVGTGTRFGHGGMAVTEAANASVALGARTIIAPRVSFADERPRHHGLSHHTRAALDLCLGQREVAWPAGLDHPEGIDVVDVDVDGWQEACAPLALEHMGRGPDDDPWFFASAFAAGRLAASVADARS